MYDIVKWDNTVEDVDAGTEAIDLVIVYVNVIEDGVFDGKSDTYELMNNCLCDILP